MALLLCGAMVEAGSFPKLQVIGGGRMGEALISGLVAAGWADVDELSVVEVVEARADELLDAFPGIGIVDRPTRAQGHLLAVKPDQIAATCVELARAHGGEPVLSVAAGVTISRLEADLPVGAPVIRAMPNTPSLVGAGAAAIVAGRHAGQVELDWASEILGAVGTVVAVKDEALLDAVTGLSGSGPAYLWLVVESMVEAGVLNGLPRPMASQLVAQTLVGAGRLLEESGDDPAVLRANVTSPGGTTASGLRALEQAGVRAAFLDAVTAATDRSRELGAGS